mgnify:FL=1
MNKLILILTIVPMIAFASDVSEIIRNIKKNLFIDSFCLKGKIVLKADSSKIISTNPIEINYNLNNEKPNITYFINEQFLKIELDEYNPIYEFSDASIKKSDEIFNTRMTWDDLCLSYLWWSNPKIMREEKKINRQCWVIKITSHSSPNEVLVWIDKETFFPLESQIIINNLKTKTSRIKRLKKVQNTWLPKLFEILHHDNNEKSQLWINEFLIND